MSSFAVQFPGGSEFSCSPQNVHQFLKLEGGDDRETAADLGAVGVAQINEVIANPVINLCIVSGTDVPQNISCDVDVNFGGDQAMQVSFLCVSGLGCPFCEVTSGDMCCTDLNKRFEPRTQEQTELLAHTRCGKCPGCDQVSDSLTKLTCS